MGEAINHPQPESDSFDAVVSRFTEELEFFLGYSDGAGLDKFEGSNLTADGRLEAPEGYRLKVVKDDPKDKFRPMDVRVNIGSSDSEDWKALFYSAYKDIQKLQELEVEFDDHALKLYGNTIEIDPMGHQYYIYSKSRKFRVVFDDNIRLYLKRAKK